MKVQCPICHNEGSLQQRYNSVRVGHYKGFKKTLKGQTIIVEWHATTIKNVLLVNKGKVMVNNEGKLTLFTKTDENSHCLPRSPQIMSLAPWPG
jgi:RecJ-like exonuclease